MNVQRWNGKLVWLAPLLLWGCGTSENGDTQATRAVPVAVVEVRSAKIEELHEAMGSLRGQQTAVLMTSKVSGYVQELTVGPGDTVEAGRVVAVIEAPELEARLRAARHGLEEAAEAETEAEGGLEAAFAQAEIAAVTLDRFRALQKKRAVTRQEFDEVEARARAARAQKEMAEARLRRARSARSRAEAEVEAAETFWNYTRVRAPFDGRVLERRVDLGNLASPGAPLYVFEKEGALRAEVSVPESLAGVIRVGDAAEVVIGSEAEPLKGMVAEVVPSVDAASRAFLVKVELPLESGARLPAGRFARVIFTVGEAERLLVPQSAIVSRGQLSMVFVVEDETARLRLVSLGNSRDGRVEILSGLSDGDRIVRQPARDLVDGARVEAAS